ncbi:MULTISPECIES: acyl-CoA dehydrogenase family protein [Rhodococcus]|uniref:Acyl-CoA dehydrogenase domain-containing protein n=2 Tax=Rhodococcus opacus TaxID=37919 RepID=A0A1B1KEP4_RHOOP|nr:acyl-CoA dehydrogenase family protein [Rhodococcus opacus]ELB90204.1 acyl-CoA dehydrogenase [Rhodococcus wratislaviensis IFP 2016]NHU45877.1 acyl-CoA/acyl-ACP dehydrogenase [Rhodococcus sp. A14]ANS31029.1 acyl-CoA dehydrogenase domain-containing protein [Rhodococcus opacus]MDX5967584.1 acyl-CoA dehydrogenase family protein [Rhodococcus opacus]NKY76102.1 acyl-CoA/acyl-ACP dehydrogenase [Rhodococcus opacus]
MTTSPFMQQTPERTELAGAIRRLLDQHVSSRSEDDTGSADGFDRRIWQLLAESIGVPAMAIPEDVGGVGFGFSDLLPVFEEAGRVLYGSPLLSSVGLATPLIRLAADAGTATRLLPDLASGASTAAVAWLENPTDRSSRGVHARIAGSKQFALSGHTTHVIDGYSADILLVLARLGEQTAIFVVEGTAPGLLRSPMDTIDLSRSQASLTFDVVPAVLLGEAQGGMEALGRAQDYAALALAAESTGAARRCLESAVEYAKSRRQFGQPIGAFQAVKHRCAEMWASVETAAALVGEASRALETHGVPSPLDTTHALIAAVDALDFCAQESMRVHGGISFTWEHSAHRYYRRARSVQTLLGPMSRHRERLTALSGIHPN